MQIGDEAPDLFLVDIQQDQAAPLRQFLAERLPGNAAEVDSRAARARHGPRRAAWTRWRICKGRGSCRGSTRSPIAAQLEPNETLVAGRFPNPRTFVARCMPEVSVEEGMRERFGISVGDIVRFDVLGRVDQCPRHRRPAGELA